jgi:23S rRNA (cytidine1920-2'-O)/16S rRNA (cytidine1409-2'-O)-methyltransferase
VVKRRLDQALVARGLVPTRSQAENLIKLGQVKVGGRVITKPEYLVDAQTSIELTVAKQYVSRAALKLASVAEALKVDFRDKVVLDIGSSTGGFTQYALEHGARRVIAVDIGSNQLHPSLRNNSRVELHENTDFRNFVKGSTSHIDVVLADISFTSLREILPHAQDLGDKNTSYVVMVKPQFEVYAGHSRVMGDKLKHGGVVKNERMRRDILKDFEQWARQYFVIVDKADSAVAGTKGNHERFYLLTAIF